MSRRLVTVLSAVLLFTPIVSAGAHPGHDEPSAAPAAAEYGAGWKPLSRIAGGPRQEHSVAAIGSRIYLLGGIEPNPGGGVVTTDRVEVYDSRANRWSEGAPLPVAMNHPNAAVVGGT